MITITPEQQKLVEDNHNLIYTFLKYRNLSIEEYYDVAAIGLCKAAINYKGEKSKFSTYAFALMKNEVLMQFRLKTAAKSIPEAQLIYYSGKVDGAEDDSDTSELINYIPSVQNTEEEAIINVALNKYRSQLKNKHKQVVDLALAGYKQREIARYLKLSQGQVSRILKEVRKYIAN